MEIVLGIMTLAMASVVGVSVMVVFLRGGRGVRLTVSSKEPLVVPSSFCAINGSEASEKYFLFRVFYIVSILHVYGLYLPFSKEGLAAYKNAMPSSVLLYKGGFYFLAHIPVLGIMLALFWVWLGALPCGVLAVVDLFRGKRQLLKVHRVRTGVFSDNVYTIDISGVSERFAAETLRVNTGEPLDQYLTKQRKAWLSTYTSRPGASRNEGDKE